MDGILKIIRLKRIFGVVAIHVFSTFLSINATLPLIPLENGKLSCTEADTFCFGDIAHQIKPLGGGLTFLSLDHLPSWKKGFKIFNPSLINFNNKIFITFRLLEGAWYSQTFFAELDDNYLIKNEYCLVAQTKSALENVCIAADARLAIRGGSLFFSYVWESYLRNSYQHFIAASFFEPGEQITAPLRPAVGTNKLLHCTEKNWVFFEKDESFLMINYIDPLEVWDCTNDLENPIFLYKKTEKMDHWRYGEPRASTTPLYLEEYELWLMFFHSYLLTRDNIRTYFLGALAFDNNFNLVGYTHNPLVVSTPHIPRSIVSNTVLPYGCIREKDNIVLSLGINDSAAAIARFPLDCIMHSLTQGLHVNMKNEKSNLLVAGGRECYCAFYELQEDKNIKINRKVSKRGKSK